MLVLLALCASARAADPLATPISLRAERRPVGELLAELGQKSRLRFSAPRAVAEGVASLFVELVPLGELFAALEAAFDLRFELDAERRSCRVSAGPGTEAALPSGQAARKAGRCRRAPGSRPVSVVCRNAPVEAYLAAVSAQAPFNAILTRDMPAQRVSVELKEATAEDALKRLSSAKNLDYRSVGSSRIYLISPKPRAPKRKAR